VRKLVYAINVTLDGCCDHTKAFLEPRGDGSNEGMEEILQHYTRLLGETDLLVYGRKTYQLMVPYWPDVAKNHSMPKAANEFADTFDSLDKLVFSRTLEGAGEKTRIVRTDLRDEILRLKQEPGKLILAGGVALSSQLIELGLVDEYRIVVFPSVAGEGRRLMEGVSLKEKLPLQLVETKVLKSGCVALRYAKA
jgi:dihydrofolate reductase